MNEAKIKETIYAVANGFGKPLWTPILRTPADEGLDFENVTFPTVDDPNIELSAWFIPAKGSNKLVIANHPMCFSKYGYPGHIEKYQIIPGNDFEVNFLPDYKHLHDAGYNVLAYDLRNFGDSSKARDNISTAGLDESNDVIASVLYAKEHQELGKMEVSLFSRCMGANSTIIAIARSPTTFEHIKCAIFLQPISMRPFFVKTLEGMGLTDRLSELDIEYKNVTGHNMDEPSPVEPAKSVKLPSLVIQVHGDVSTDPSDVQAIFDNIDSKDKELFWIEGTTKRFDGYNYLPQKNPKLMIDWFNNHM